MHFDKVGEGRAWQLIQFLIIQMDNCIPGHWIGSLYSLYLISNFQSSWKQAVLPCVGFLRFPCGNSAPISYSFAESRSHVGAKSPMYTKLLKMEPRAGTWIRKENRIKSLWFPFSHSFRIDRKKDKTERKILDSQERAFWDVHRPVVRKLCSGLCSPIFSLPPLKRKDRL